MSEGAIPEEDPFPSPRQQPQPSLDTGWAIGQTRAGPLEEVWSWTRDLLSFYEPLREARRASRVSSPPDGPQ